VDVGDLPNHVKYCVSVCLAFNGQLSEHHRSAHRGAEIPNIYLDWTDDGYYYYLTMETKDAELHEQRLDLKF